MEEIRVQTCRMERLRRGIKGRPYQQCIILASCAIVSLEALALPNYESSSIPESMVPGMLITAICVRRSLPTECCQSKTINAQREISIQAWTNNDRRGWKRTSVWSSFRVKKLTEEPVRQDWIMKEAPMEVVQSCDRKWRKTRKQRTKC
jgi:hypothetical protein